MVSSMVSLKLGSVCVIFIICTEAAPRPKPGDYDTWCPYPYPWCPANSESNSMSGACDQPAGVGGPCYAYMPRWTFNRATRTCEQFVYGGCHGNKNRFGSKAECEKKCGVIFGKGVCDQPAGVGGPCLANMPRWTFNRATRTCEQFVYGGCQGNKNSFGSKAECEKKCGVTFGKGIVFARDHTGPNGIKWDQMGPYWTIRDHAEPNQTIQDHTSLNVSE